MNKEQLLELVIAWFGNIAIQLVLLIMFSLIGLGIGVFMVTTPVLSIELQRRFYSRINWKIEPISLAKEIRNTRAMGWFLIILSIITIALVFFKCPLFL